MDEICHNSSPNFDMVCFWSNGCDKSRVCLSMRGVWVVLAVNLIEVANSHHQRRFQVAHADSDFVKRTDALEYRRQSYYCRFSCLFSDRFCCTTVQFCSLSPIFSFVSFRSNFFLPFLPSFFFVFVSFAVVPFGAKFRLLLSDTTHNVFH